MSYSIVVRALSLRLASVLLAPIGVVTLVLLGPLQSATASSQAGYRCQDARLPQISRMAWSIQPADVSASPSAVAGSTAPPAPTAPVAAPTGGVGHRSVGLVIVLLLAAGAILLARLLRRRPRPSAAQEPIKPEDQPDLP